MKLTIQRFDDDYDVDLLIQSENSDEELILALLSNREADNLGYSDEDKTFTVRLGDISPCE